MSVCPPNHVYVMLQSMSSYCCGLAVVEEGDPGEWVGEAGGISTDESTGLVHVGPQLEAVPIWRNQNKPKTSDTNRHLHWARPKGSYLIQSG